MLASLELQAGVSLMYGTRRPTEAEWDLVRSGDGIQIPDIETTEAADTSTIQYG